MFETLNCTIPRENCSENLRKRMIFLSFQILNQLSYISSDSEPTFYTESGLQKVPFKFLEERSTQTHHIEFSYRSPHKTKTSCSLHYPQSIDIAFAVQASAFVFVSRIFSNVVFALLLHFLNCMNSLFAAKLFAAKTATKTRTVLIPNKSGFFGENSDRVKQFI